VVFAVGVCSLPSTGGSTFVVVAGLFIIIAGVIVSRWVRQSAGRLSVVVAPLVLLGSLVLAPSVTDACVPSTTVAATTTTPGQQSTTTTVALTTTTTTAVSPTTTLAPIALYQVGDPGPGGGTIFYVDLLRPAGSQYFEVACAGWQNNCDGSADPQVAWGCMGTSIAGAGGTAIGDGAQNTLDILAGCLDAGIAADLAGDYSRNTLDDWFLPSQDEFNALCKWAYGDTVNAICDNGGTGGLTLAYGGFSSGVSSPVYYWGSFEYNDNLAWFQDFNFAYQYDFKSSVLSVRPVRAF